MAFLSEQGLDVSILDGLRGERGRQSPNPAARRRVKRALKGRLPADRIAAALGTQPVVPLQKASSPPKVWVPKRTLKPGPPLESGRHRGTDTPSEHWVSPPATAAGLPRHARIPLSSPRETAPADSVPREPLPVVPRRSTQVRVVPAAVDAASGRHRRPDQSKTGISGMPATSRAIQAHFRLLVMMGVLALVVAVAMMFGVRVVVSRSSAETQLATTTTTDLVSGMAVSTGAPPTLATTKAPAPSR